MIDNSEKQIQILPVQFSKGSEDPVTHLPQKDSLSQAMLPAAFGNPTKTPLASLSITLV